MRGKSVPERPLERPCLDCDGHMVIIHDGAFTTVYACSACGTTLTIPPKYPLGRQKEADQQ
jgi:hypothetical protein